MLVVDRKRLIFRIKEIYFRDYPYEVNDCDCVRFPLCKNKVDAEGFICTECYTSVIDLTQDLNTIWGNMSRGNCRKPINRAERAGIKIKLNQNHHEFYEIYRSTRKAKDVPGFPLSLEDIKGMATLFVAEFNGESISGHGYLEDEANMISWVIGSKRFEKDKERVTLVGNASKLIIWEAIKYAKGKGIRVFNMGELWPEEKAEGDEVKRNINFFKQSFGGVTVNCYSYEKAYSKTYRFTKYLYQLASQGLKVD